MKLLSDMVTLINIGPTADVLLVEKSFLAALREQDKKVEIYEANIASWKKIAGDRIKELQDEIRRMTTGAP